MKSFITIVASLMLGGAAVADTIYVAQDGSGDYISIQAAIDESFDGDTISIAAGTYLEHSLNPGGRAITIQGELNSDGAPAVIVDAQEQGTVFVFQSSEGFGTRIEGLEIARGTGSNIDGYNVAGGIYCDDSDPTISNCVIRDNRAHAGGGILCKSASPTITGCTFSNNEATVYDGGGIHCQFDSNLVINNCVISGNTADRYGAGIYVGIGAHVGLTGCVVSNGTANGDGGGIYFEYSSDATLDGCLILDNVAVSDGGGIYCSSSSPAITGCRIENNTATSDGGGIFCGGNSQPQISDCVIAGNIAVWRGGGIWCYQDPQIFGCVISNNIGAQGGGIYGGTPVLMDTTVCGNDPDQVDSNWTDGGGNEILEVCPPGACCTNDICLLTEESDCLLYGGQWLGVGSSCDDCPPPVEPEDTGACCVDGYCTSMTEAQCFDLSGSYAGDNVTCADAGCPGICLGDLNGDGEVGITDLLTIIDKWGICP